MPWPANFNFHQHELSGSKPRGKLQAGKMSEKDCVSLSPSSSTPPVQRTSVEARNKVQSKCDKHTVPQPQIELTPCAGEQQTYAFLVFIVASSYIGFLYRLRSLQAQAVAGLTTSDFSKNVQVSIQPPSAANLHLTGKGRHKSFPSHALTLSDTRIHTKPRGNVGRKGARHSEGQLRRGLTTSPANTPLHLSFVT